MIPKKRPTFPARRLFCRREERELDRYGFDPPPDWWRVLAWARRRAPRAGRLIVRRHRAALRCNAHPGCRGRSVFAVIRPDGRACRWCRPCLFASVRTVVFHLGPRGRT